MSGIYLTHIGKYPKDMPDITINLVVGKLNSKTSQENKSSNTNNGDILYSGNSQRRAFDLRVENFYKLFIN